MQKLIFLHSTRDKLCYGQESRHYCKRQGKLNCRHLEALDLARAHAVLLCTRPLASADSFLLRLTPAEGIPLEIKETADEENFLQDEKKTTKLHTGNSSYNGINNGKILFRTLLSLQTLIAVPRLTKPSTLHGIVK